MYIQNVNLDVNAQPDANAKPCLRLSQNENGRVLMIRIIGVDIPEGSTANFAGLKPDGNVYSKAGTVEGNVVSINEDIQMTAVSGAWNAKITVVNDGNNICTARIRVVVDASVVPGDAIPSDSQLDGIVAECQAYAESAKNAAYGSPLTANTAADMTDQDRVYVYTGSETGYTAGHWYYYDGSAWADGGVYNAVAVQTDTTLTQAGKAADAKKTGDEISTLKEELSNSIILNDNLLANAKWEVGSINGTTGADTSASTVYRTGYIEIGDMESVKLHVDSGYKFCAVFINAAKTAVVYTVSWTVSDKYVDISTITGAKYLRILYQTTSNTLPSSFSYITATYKTKLIDAAKKSIEFIKDPTIEFVSGNYYNCVTHAITPSTSYSYTKIPIAFFNGGKINGRTGIVPDTPSTGIAFVDENDNYISSEYSTNTGHYEYDYDILIPDNAAYVYINLRDQSSNLWIAPTFPWGKMIENIQKLSETKGDVENLQRVTSNEIVPILRNGSVVNSSNANAVTSEFITPIPNDYDYLMIQFTGNTTNSNQYGFVYTLFHGATDGMSTTAAFTDSGIIKKNVNNNFDAVVPETVPHIVVPASELTGYEHISVTIFRKNNGTYVPIRIDTEQYCVKLTFGINVSDNINQRGITNNDILKKANDARHIKGNAVTPLTILHFSDLHKDINAMNRIMEDAESFGDTIDSVICTGDMVLNSYEQIASWWNPNVMTCIGNHDSASYSSGSGYNWTALSMANRDAYYIAPFESNWGITHTSGTSYYYKDYAESKVRLIVMDAMLYSDNGQEANTQTAWLENLLASAITGDLHVLIAIHAPHGGATAKECSFSRYNQTAWPTQADCNTPQTVIDTVATAISGGLKFIGYLIGHTHQDNIWDTEDDGTQLMYCVTCAIVSQEAQWKNSDQYRDANNDAYNIVTIDTANTLVKIVRGGGADIDDHMRTRKAICFNYSTGQMVGEVL